MAIICPACAQALEQVERSCDRCGARFTCCEDGATGGSALSASATNSAWSREDLVRGAHRVQVVGLISEVMGLGLTLMGIGPLIAREGGLGAALLVFLFLPAGLLYLLAGIGLRLLRPWGVRLGASIWLLASLWVVLRATEGDWSVGASIFTLGFVLVPVLSVLALVTVWTPPASRVFDLPAEVRRGLTRQPVIASRLFWLALPLLLAFLLWVAAWLRAMWWE